MLYNEMLMLLNDRIMMCEALIDAPTTSDEAATAVAGQRAAYMDARRLLNDLNNTPTERTDR